MAAKRIYSCDFCRAESAPLAGVYWVKDCGHDSLEARLMCNSERHICRTCFVAIRGMTVPEHFWQNPKEPA